MSKAIVLILILAGQIGLSHAQYVFEFGNITSKEVDLKECAFDPEAAAAVLMDAGYSDHDGEYQLLSYKHTRIKILKESGLDYADVKIPYYSEDDFEYIDDVRAAVINIDEKGNRREYPVDKKLIYRRKINKYRSEISFVFPEAKVGSIIEYQYRKTAKNYGGLRDWNFQDYLPVYQSSYELKTVPTREITYLLQKADKYKVKIDQRPSTQSVFFEMKDIPGLSDEPYMDAREDYIQKVIFQTTKFLGYTGPNKFMSDWKEVIKDLMVRPDFGRQLKIEIKECEDFVTAATIGKTALEKMNIVYEYVRKNTSWNGMNSIVSEDGIKTLWSKKTGNSASINILLINLLKSAGLEAYPMLVSERGNGKVNKATPFINQFNSVYAAVIVNERKYYLDATDPFTPSGLIPYSVLNTTGFIVHNKAGGLVDIEEPKLRYRDVISIDAHLGENGKLTGGAQIMSKDYARVERLRGYIKDKEHYVDKYIKRQWINVVVDSLKLTNEDTDSLPLQQNFTFNYNVETTGDYAFLNLNTFTGFESNPFITNERFSTINFGYGKTIHLNYVIHIPENFTIDEVPKSIKMVNEDRTVTFIREINKSPASDYIVARIKVEQNKSLYGPEEYTGIKEFYKKMIDLMNEQIVLKQKL